LGLGYLALERPAATLSTGERQRMQLARAVRNRATGVLYVLDEPSIGLHPANIAGLAGVMRDLVADGNSVVLVDHDAQLLRQADWFIELGPGAGAQGGRVIAQGGLQALLADPASRIAPFLSGEPQPPARPRAAAGDIFALGAISLRTRPLHTVQALDVRFPRGRLSAVTGVSGSGKTTLVLECLVPALEALARGDKPPAHIDAVYAAGVRCVKLIDATPIGANVRSTVATYAGVHDELRRAFARTGAARAAGLKAGDFSYNTGSLRCPQCDGTGVVELDVQFLPDVEIPCPACRGSRYRPECGRCARPDGRGGEVTLPGLMAMDVSSALAACGDIKGVRQRLAALEALGLGYLALGEATPALSGGEAQRLKLAGETGRGQEGAVFVFDEPTIGLHPLDVRRLMGIFQKLVGLGATVIVIEHDLDVIAGADYVVDLGPGGGEQGGRVVAAGAPEEVAACPASLTGAYLKGAGVRPAAPESAAGRPAGRA
ncbi:MAG: excinuclease ABC subunit UvrA, partial [Duodenibacillus sp.]|nr:excinuclease ABC subunit UvrA [Duodenibacillus sp.]